MLYILHIFAYLYKIYIKFLFVIQFGFYDNIYAILADNIFSILPYM